MAANERRYLSFLLRLWCIKQDGCETWRASLEDPRTGEQRGFASLDLMVDFLRNQIQSAGDEQNNRISDTTDESS
jgi:hypothetical protein